MGQALITLSVVSHQQCNLAEQLLADLNDKRTKDVEIIFTMNVAEQLTFAPGDFNFPLRIVRNEIPKGFGANHNAAFRRCTSPYFCILNPDIRISEDPFEPLLSECKKPSVGAVAPMIVDAKGECEDNARRFPTVPALARKAILKERKLDYAVADQAISPDWVAGMFMLFPSDVFTRVNGFDERYYLYYEDVDLCRRLRSRGFDVRLVPSVHATHLAQRTSHKNLRYLRWHVESMMRFMYTRDRRGDSSTPADAPGPRRRSWDSYS